MFPSIRVTNWLYIGIPLFILCAYSFSWHDSPAFSINGTPGSTRSVLMTRPPHNSLAPTTIPGGAYVHGFTTLDQLYVRQGTFYIVTEDPSTFPPREFLISSGKSMDTHMDKMEASDEHLRFISRKEAKEILGEHATRVQGFTMILWEDKQFMVHLYHWWGEIILGAWRVYAHLSQKVGAVDLEAPTLFILPNVDADAWRDRANIDGPYMRAAFPDAPIETSTYWKDLIKLNTTVVFDRVMLADRYTAHRHPWGLRWFKMIAGTLNVTTPVDFWGPVRNNVLQNILGYDLWTANTAQRRGLPVVTYISRQKTPRRLVHQDHDLLVTELMKLHTEGVAEVHVAVMERMSVKEQIDLISRSTIIIGVHGNGLTNQLWMPPSPRSAVFEIFYPPGYAYDYEILSRNMGHRHYAVHNDTIFTPQFTQFNEGQALAFPDGFHSDRIPAHGPAIARTIKQVLTQGHL